MSTAILLFPRPRFGRILFASAALATMALPTAPALALNEGLQCVPYARQLSGVQIFGDAHTWWGQAQGKYGTGRTPKIGAVLAFKPHGKMQLGHVGAVSKIVDSRSILMSHANWSTINGRRGHIENNVQVVDVSERNDWSRVRVWYTPTGSLGTTEWPTHGFIYPDKAPKSMPTGSGPIQYAGPSAAKPAPNTSAKPAKPVPVVAAKAPQPQRLIQHVTPQQIAPEPAGYAPLAPPAASGPARVTYAPPASAPKPHAVVPPTPQGQRPLRDYNAAPAHQPAPPRQYQPAPPVPRAQQPLPNGYTPSTAAPGVRAQGPQSIDDLLAGVK